MRLDHPYICVCECKNINKSTPFHFLDGEKRTYGRLFHGYNKSKPRKDVSSLNQVVDGIYHLFIGAA